MKPTTFTFVLLAAVGIVLTAGLTAQGEPLPGQLLKFQQLPMIETGGPAGVEVYYGHDEESTLYGLDSFVEPGGPLQFPITYTGNYVADDFADPFATPVLHLRWWGSRLDQTTNEFPIEKFLITFETDVAVDDPNNLYDFSHPGDPILSQVVIPGPLAPGSGTFEETPIHPGGPPLNEELIEYNAELAFPFEQEPDTVYWLKIAALVDIQDYNNDGTVDLSDLVAAPRWGWHNRDYTIPDPFASVPPVVNPGEYLDGVLADGTEVWHFQDDAVAGGEFGMEAVVHNPDDPSAVDVNQLLSPLPEFLPDFVPQFYLPGVDGPSEIGLFSKDLAFELYTIPEPSTLILVGLGCVLLPFTRDRRQRG